MNREERRVMVGGMELRADADKAPRIVGYAAKFNVWSEDLGGFRERIEPGAFDRVLKEKHDVRALVNHEGIPFARSSSGTLSLSVDDVGLRVEAELPRSRTDLVEALERGDIDQMSFGFRVGPGGSAWDLESDPAERTITEVAELLDVSVVTYPAYPQTEVALRALADARAETTAPEPQPPVERLAREIKAAEVDETI